MVDIGDALPNRVIRHLFGRANAADAAAFDLNVSDLADINSVARQVDVVRRLATGELYRARALSERSIGFIGTAIKRLLELGGPDLLQDR